MVISSATWRAIYGLQWPRLFCCDWCGCLPIQTPVWLFAFGISENSTTTATTTTVAPTNTSYHKLSLRCALRHLPRNCKHAQKR